MFLGASSGPSPAVQLRQIYTISVAVGARWQRLETVALMPTIAPAVLGAAKAALQVRRQRGGVVLVELEQGVPQVHWAA